MNPLLLRCERFGIGYRSPNKQFALVALLKVGQQLGEVDILLMLAIQTSGDARLKDSEWLVGLMQQLG
jgi:hypothetical protein